MLEIIRIKCKFINFLIDKKWIGKSMKMKDLIKVKKKKKRRENSFTNLRHLKRKKKKKIVFIDTGVFCVLKYH